MANFLSWLFGVESNVYAWFGSNFWSLYSGAANALNWATQQAGSALAQAKSYAYSLLQGIQNDLRGFENWTQYQLDQLKAAAGSVVAYSYATILGWINAQIGPVLTLITSARSYALGLVNDLRASVTGLINQAVNSAVSIINGGLTWINSVRSYLTTLTTTLSLAYLPNLVALASSLYADIRALFDDPVKWMLDLLQLDLLDALQWLIAMSLGTVESPLPKQPPWRR